MEFCGSHLGLVLAIALAPILLLALSRRLRGTRLETPPGPPPLPILGNVFDIPKSFSALEYRQLSEKYGAPVVDLVSNIVKTHVVWNAKTGDVVHLNAVGQSMIVLGSLEAATELLEKRSAKYSGKPTSVMAKLCGFDWTMALLGTESESWRRQRRETHRFISPTTVSRYYQLLENQAYTMLKKIMDDPACYSEHIHHTLGLIISQATYGIDDDEHLGLLEEGHEIFIKAFVPGKYLAESLPFLQYVPDWFPGAQFKRDAKTWKARFNAIKREPFDAAMKAMNQGGVGDLSIAAAMIEGQDPSAVSPEDKELAEMVCSAVYLGGAETTLTTLRVFILLMATHPQAQARAQAELDAVVGPDRLPSVSDRGALPYVDAVLKECLRWHPILPLALLRTATAEDEYRGWRIPKGAIVMANSWAFARDPTLFPNPDQFSPERFLDADGRPDKNALDPRTFTFGYGRRVCPGRHFAEATLFAVMASLLHVFNLAPPVDGDGRPVPLEPKFTPDLLSSPEPFGCQITVRSDAAKALVVAAGQV
ncbi:CyP450 monooxygenase [Epithele typhae]|uniref:CyP450 monooxygenase n=1 Tax=Epithele typhae TaxID=378194 RepID=UPI002008039C|nr:CyP450 monooxygenase [Epithele typhae]KAH9937831.1 CyP450 monooxygenase [Epithele typhae]